MTTIVGHLSYCPKERRRVSRVRVDYAHQALVLFCRARDRKNGLRYPRWTPPATVRSAEPPPYRRRKA